MSTLSPNMGLLISTVGVDSGLLWEQNLNASEVIIDGHNHTPGFGVQIPPAGLNINSALTFNNNSATSLQSAVFTPQTSLATLDSIYFSGVDFYVNDGAGNVIKITSGGAVNATSSGIVSGSASASFVSSTLVVNEAAATPANIQAGSILIGNNVASSNFAEVQVPNSLAANYNFVLPPGYPGATSFLQMDTSGNVTASIPVSGGIEATNIDPAAGLNPPGAVIMYGGGVAPTGWLLCDGSSYSISTYAALFAAIGYTYGGSGSSFNVPNAQGVFVRGAGSQTINAVSYSGSRGTAENDAYASHHHLIYGSTSGGVLNNPQQSSAAGLGAMSTGAGEGYVNAAPTGGSQYIDNAGTGTETQPANICLTYIIKT